MGTDEFNAREKQYDSVASHSLRATERKKMWSGSSYISCITRIVLCIVNVIRLVRIGRFSSAHSAYSLKKIKKKENQSTAYDNIMS